MVAGAVGVAAGAVVVAGVVAPERLRWKRGGRCRWRQTGKIPEGIRLFSDRRQAVDFLLQRIARNFLAAERTVKFRPLCFVLYEK